MNPKAILAQAKQYMEFIKEAKAMAESLGIKLPGLKLPGQAETSVHEERAVQSVNKVQAFVAMIQVKYGDLTVAELVDRLKAEFGDVRLSEISRGKKLW